MYRRCAAHPLLPSCLLPLPNAHARSRRPHTDWPAACRCGCYGLQLWRSWDPPGKQRRRRYVYNDVGINFALLAMHGRQAAFVFIDLDEFLMTPQPMTMAQVGP